MIGKLQSELREAVLAQTMLMDAPPQQIRARLGTLRTLARRSDVEPRDCPTLVSEALPKGVAALHSDVIIGSSRACDIQLDDECVSHEHCTLKKVAEGWLLEDRGSTNGVYVNGRKVRRRILLDGDLLQVGNATLTFFREQFPA